jgi:tRNA pseudouridine55 synthase
VTWNGVLLVDKPTGITSHDVVGRLRRVTGERRIGHGGTLDPLATGLLPVFLGPATKLSPFVTGHDKGYETSARLGVRTDTLDADGTVLSESPVDPALDAARLEPVLDRFRGLIDQQPPMHSAVKVDGRRLYEHARQGREVDRPARQVVIHHLRLLSFESPELRLDVRCSKGTYIRQLVADIGEALGCGAHVTALRRTLVGSHEGSEATPLGDLTDPDAVARALIPPRDYVARLFPTIEIDPGDLVTRLRQGQRPSWDALGHAPLEPATRFALVTHAELIAMAEVTSEGKAPYRLLRVWAGA